MFFRMYYLNLCSSEWRMAFYYLFLGHLVGDFVLQTDKIAENKGRQWKWNLLHVLVVTLSVLLFSYPFGALLSVLVILNGLVHYILDHYKSNICKILHLSELAGFLGDQFIHIVLLYIISLTAVYEKELLIEFTTVKLLIILSMVTSFLAIFTQYVLAALFPGENRRFFENGEKIFGMLSRIYITIVFYLSFHKSPLYLVFLALAVILFFVQYKRIWRNWMSLPHLLAKLLLDMAVPVLCIIMVM